jgi:superfamily II DNA or RNA helicase
MTRADRFIASCASWDEFHKRVSALSEAEKGGHFERLVQLYLQTQPEYRTALANVWLLRDVPADVRRAINLPQLDEGIDLIARERHGGYWAIQAKFLTANDKRLSRRLLGTFTALASDTCSNIALQVVAHTSAKRVGKHHLYRNLREIGLDRWQDADWSLIRAAIAGKVEARPKPRRPKRHQLRAIAAAKKHFIGGKAHRGLMLMPCGTGKSLTAFWIAEALGAKTILVAVPSLALIKQSVTDWTREFLAKDQKPDWACVCSDDSVGDLERDEFVGDVYDTGLPTFTDPEEIAKELRRPSKIKIVFTTYQSADRLVEAAKFAGTKFDVAIFDEAHRTTGKQSKSFATLLRADALKARYRLFMTATERKVNGDVEVFSMDNEDDYGKRFFTMTFKEAISLGIISDYKILTIAVTDKEINDLIASNRLLNLHEDLDEAEARAVATGMALKRIYKKYGVKHAISFHSSIRMADRFRAQQDVLNCLTPTAANFHISSQKTAGERKLLMDEFKAAPRALMTNARCLTEGVDVPAIDCVAFADPKQSTTDIVQASGRAMRLYKGKKYGYIVVPIVVPENTEFAEFAETTAFRAIVRIITALSVHDTRIVDELRAIHHGRNAKGKIIKIDGKVPVGMRMSLDRFADAITLKMWESVARVNWRSFEEAREFVRKLSLESVKQWNEYCLSGKKPADIPNWPVSVYADAGWDCWADWLGSSRRVGNWRPFEEARAFVRRLRIEGKGEWETQYCCSGKKPVDIPNSPFRVYADAGWKGWGDWLGNDHRRRGADAWRSFPEARTFVRKLRLKSKNDWDAYCRSEEKPFDIPNNPSKVYADLGWSGVPDWLGNGVRRGGWRPFTEARTFVRKLKLNSHTDWRKYCESGQRPEDVPKHPVDVYADAGWEGWGDWLGTGRLHTIQKRSFKEARTFAQSLRLKSVQAWRKWYRSGKKPADIPANPDRDYINKGWIGWSDWLGNGRHDFLPFVRARARARRLGLKSSREWDAYCRSGKKPANIPKVPHKVYADAGWSGLHDWLGRGDKTFR